MSNLKKILLRIFVLIFLMRVNITASELDINKIGALGAVLIDAQTGRILWEKNSHKKLAMASTTKIMTALIALECANLEDLVIISKSVLQVPKVKMNLIPGEKIKLKYLLHALMLESSNDAAVAIAEHISGSVKNFCELMTQKAKQIGAYNTVFETPNGLDKGEHHSTAYDMALITRRAFLNQDFINLINKPESNFKSDKKTYVMHNKNRLLREFNGANGVKTGFTGKAGHCFVGAAKRNDMQLISVVLGSGWGTRGKEGKWTDTKKILNYGFENYKYKNLIQKNNIASNIKINHSRTQNINLIYEQDLCVPVKLDGEEINIKICAPEILEAPVKQHDILGVAKIFINKKLLSQINLLADNNALRHDLKTSFGKILNEWQRLGNNFGL